MPFIKKIFSLFFYIGGVLAVFVLSLGLSLLMLKLLTYPMEGILFVKHLFKKQPVAHEQKREDTPDQPSHIYPGKTKDEVEAIRADWAKSPDFFPENYIPFESKYLNVVSPGYRTFDNLPSYDRTPGRINVFIFGGSTAFGYYLPDNETIAAHLQRALNVQDPLKQKWCVYNFGVLSSYSHYERLFLERLLEEGYIPDYVIFIDGFNDFSHLGINIPSFKRYGRTETDWMGKYKEALGELIKYWLVVFKRYDEKKQMLSYKLKFDDEDIQRASRQMLHNWQVVRGIADASGFKSLFVLQPTSVYPDIKEREFLNEDDLADQGRRWYYRANREGYRYIHASNVFGSFPFLDLSGLSMKSDVHFIDTCHYTSAFSKAIAGEIAQSMLKGRNK